MLKRLIVVFLGLTTFMLGVLLGTNWSQTEYIEIEVPVEVEVIKEVEVPYIPEVIPEYNMPAEVMIFPELLIGEVTNATETNLEVKLSSNEYITYLKVSGFSYSNINIGDVIVFQHHDLNMLDWKLYYAG